MEIGFSEAKFEVFAIIFTISFLLDILPYA